MRVFAISDLHLSGAVDKPMDIFGEEWENHAERIARNWDLEVGSSDLVLIPGDISWAMTLNEAKPDLSWIADRPGLKVMVRGNHDYWWSSISRVRAALEPGVYALQNDSIAFGHVVVCGTRGWVLRDNPDFTDHDEKILAREVLRLRMSLDSAVEKRSEIERTFGRPAVVIAMLHYPPVVGSNDESEFARVLSEYGVDHCVYGHLHGEATAVGFEGVFESVHYWLVSADHLRFRPGFLFEEQE
ncbi:MAG: metallophosphoesterase [Bacillota bacterium]|nr:phosphohydrolase [Bacillota bacterium]HOB90405.1 metallophosphoesterase [Bacillota bacterium]HPZ53855.1 metallophosphoesterase [Bacillota bacterium]HQD17364.1 metallophosphoesterase [Bacillota bacterium]